MTSVDLKPGNMVGPTIAGQSTNDLIDQDPDLAVWNDARQLLPERDLGTTYRYNWMNSPRVVRIPIYDPERSPISEAAAADQHGSIQSAISPGSGSKVSIRQGDGQGTVYRTGTSRERLRRIRRRRPGPDGTGS